MHIMGRRVSGQQDRVVDKCTIENMCIFLFYDKLRFTFLTKQHLELDFNMRGFRKHTLFQEADGWADRLGLSNFSQLWVCVASSGTLGDEY